MAMTVANWKASATLETVHLSTLILMAKDYSYLFGNKSNEIYFDSLIAGMYATSSTVTQKSQAHNLTVSV